ncbi:MAG: hypothetical protein KAV25_01755 [Methanophagales archaeon]|nr:hypothetical protein [Methanophagales archaeon]
MRLGRERVKNTPGIIHPTSFSILIAPDVSRIKEVAEGNLGERKRTAYPLLDEGQNL